MYIFKEGGPIPRQILGLAQVYVTIKKHEIALTQRVAALTAVGV